MSHEFPITLESLVGLPLRESQDLVVKWLYTPEKGMNPTTRFLDYQTFFYGSPEMLRNWVSIMQRDPTYLYYFIRRESERAGLIGISNLRSLPEVGIVITRAYQGNRLATPAIMSLLERYQEVVSHQHEPLPLMARIREDHAASERAFERAGFRLRRIQKRETVFDQGRVVAMRQWEWSVPRRVSGY